MQPQDARALTASAQEALRYRVVKELLNHDVKANAVGRQRPNILTQMMDNLRSYLRSTQHYPHIIQNYFREKHVAYAAA